MTIGKIATGKTEDRRDPIEMLRPGLAAGVKVLRGPMMPGAPSI